MATKKAAPKSTPSAAVAAAPAPKPKKAAAKAPSKKAAPKKAPVIKATPDPARLEAEIRAEAYDYFIQRNYRPGDPKADWLRAEDAVLRRHGLR